MTAEATSKRLDRPGLALFTAGRPNSAGNLLIVQFGRRDGRAIHALATQIVPALDSEAGWLASSLDPPPATNRMRVVAVDASPEADGWLAFSAPRSVLYQPLAAILGNPRVITLVSASLHFYFPCATNPTIADGIVHAPAYYVGVALSQQSPMAGVLDLYPAQRLLIRTTNGTTVGDLGIERIAKERAPAVYVPFRN